MSNNISVYLPSLDFTVDLSGITLLPYIEPVVDTTKWDISIGYDISVNLVKNTFIFGISGEIDASNNNPITNANAVLTDDLIFIVTPDGLTQLKNNISTNFSNKISTAYLTSGNYDLSINNCNPPAFWLNIGYSGFVSSYNYSQDMSGVTVSEFMAFSISQDQFNTYEAISVWNNLNTFYSQTNTAITNGFVQDLSSMYGNWCSIDPSANYYPNSIFNNYNENKQSNLYVNNTLIPPFVYSLNQDISTNPIDYIDNPSKLIYEQFLTDISNNITSNRFDVSGQSLNNLNYAIKNYTLPGTGYAFPDVSYNGTQQYLTNNFVQPPVDGSFNFGNFWYYPFIVGDTIVFYMNLVPSSQQTLFTTNNTTRVVKFILKLV